jgi:cold shock protein
MEGKVSWFSAQKGFGFIIRDDGKADLFVHYSGIDSTGYRKLEPGQRVSFEIEAGPKGLQAGCVTVIGG